MKDLIKQGKNEQEITMQNRRRRIIGQNKEAHVMGHNI